MAIESLWLGLRPEFWQQLISILILMVILIPAAIGDYQRQKIPNWLSMCGWGIAPVVALLCTGIEGLQSSLLGLTVMLGLLFPLWVIRWFGAADVKLMGSVGAFVGLSNSLLVLLGVLLVGMVMALLIMAYRKRHSLAMTSSQHAVVSEKRFSGEATDKKSIPYGVAIAFGTMSTLLLLQLSK